MQEKNITFILGGLVGGGAEKVASGLIREWVSRGYEVTLITRLGPDTDFFTVPDSVKRIVLGGEGVSGSKVTALLKNIPFVWRLRNAIKEANQPLVISFLTKTNIHTILASFGLKSRVIISERNDTTRQNYPWPWPQLRRLLYNRAFFVTANSEIALRGMNSYVSAEKLKLVPNPVYIPEVKAVPDNSVDILNVGRLVKQKRQDLLLEAFSKLEDDLKNKWECSFLGEGEKLARLQKQAQHLHISNKINFHGLVPNPSDYYLQAGIFVLTSEFEGTPNVLLEAMAHGLPSIVPDCLPGAMKYINNGENGLIFKAGDSDDLCLKLTQLIENPDLRKRMGVEAVKSVEHLTIGNVIKEWEELMHS